MDIVTVCPKFQVVIPRKVRDALGLKPGQKIQVFSYDNRIELVLLKPMTDLRGFLKGIDTTVTRDEDREMKVSRSSLP